MSYQEPKTDWSESDTFKPGDINRVEGNIEYLAGNGGEQQLGKTDDVEFGSLTSSGTVTCSNLNTGNGNNELYPMNQAVRTTDNVVFETVNTGHGDNELYPMDQPVRTTDNVSFTAVTMLGPLYPSLSVSEGNTPLGGSGIYLIPRGWYDIYLYATSSGSSITVAIQVKIAGTWRTVAVQTAVSSASVAYAGLASDGANVRVTVSGVVTAAEYSYTRH